MALGQWVRLRVQPELFKKIFFSGLLALAALPCSTLGAMKKPGDRARPNAAPRGKPASGEVHHELA
jgi:hypothetical protein